MTKFRISPKQNQHPCRPNRPSARIPPALTGSSDIPPHPPKVSAFFPKPASSRISTCSPDRGSSFRTARPAPLFHLTRQEVPTSRLTRQRFPHSSPTKQVPLFRSGPKFPDCKKTPPSFKNGGVSLIQTSDYSAAEVSSSTLYSAMCSNRLRFSLTFS